MRTEAYLPESHAVTAHTALILYADKHSSRGCVVEHQLSQNAEGELVLGTGRNVSKSTIESILKLQEGSQRSFVEYLPPEVIATGYKSVAWVVERSERTLLFGGVTDAALAEIDGQRFPQPRLLFIASTQGSPRLALFALRGNERPTLDTPVYYAPYFNVFSNHHVCTGSMALPRTLNMSELERWVETFFHSNFTHSSRNQSTALGCSHRELWDLSREHGEFKDEWLLPVGKTLGQVLGG